MVSTSIASEYLARSLYLRSEDDLQFIFSAVKVIEPILTNKALAIIPCHVKDMEFAIRTCHLVHDQKACVCVFLNCLEFDLSPGQFSNFVEKCTDIFMQSGCKVGVDTALVFRRHGVDVRMGKVRGSIADACLIASMNVGLNVPFAFIDADTLAMSDTFFRTIQSVFSEFQPMMMVGAVHYGYLPDGTSCLPQMLHIPELLLADRVNQAILQCARNGDINFERRVWPEGANLIFDPMAYCRVGGFNWNLASGEDDAFGRAMHRYNLDSYVFPLRDVESVFETRFSNIVFSDTAWIVTDPRRHLKAIAKGGGGTEAWGFVPFDEHGGYEMCAQSLADLYQSSPYRITARMLAEWRGQRVPISPWAGSRVVELVTRTHFINSAA